MSLPEEYELAKRDIEWRYKLMLRTWWGYWEGSFLRRGYPVSDLLTIQKSVTELKPDPNTKFLYHDANAKGE